MLHYKRMLWNLKNYLFNLFSMDRKVIFLLGFVKQGKFLLRFSRLQLSDFIQFQKQTENNNDLET